MSQEKHCKPLLHIPVYKVPETTKHNIQHPLFIHLKVHTNKNSFY